ncbi:MAG: hypothetical protein HYZ20_17665 [Burkholderiales bacterium]|nr:hypothetical protein [Burkholderiales bacterium]
MVAASAHCRSSTSSLAACPSTARAKPSNSRARAVSASSGGSASPGGEQLGQQPRDVEPVGTQVGQPVRLRREQRGQRGEGDRLQALLAAQPGRIGESLGEQPRLADPRLPADDQHGRRAGTQPRLLDAAADEVGAGRGRRAIGTLDVCAAGRLGVRHRGGRLRTPGAQPGVEFGEAAQVEAFGHRTVGGAAGAWRRPAQPHALGLHRRRGVQGGDELARAQQVHAQVRQRHRLGQIGPEQRADLAARQPAAVSRQHQQQGRCERDRQLVDVAGRLRGSVRGVGDFGLVARGPRWDAARPGLPAQRPVDEQHAAARRIGGRAVAPA